MAEALDNENVNAADAESEQATDEPKLPGMLLKDIALFLAALSLWAAADTWHQITGLWVAQAVAVGDAILVGLLAASLFHEWGHYSGAMAANAKATRVDAKGLSLFRFNFDYQANDLRQFHWMTGGGHVFHWGILVLLLIALPLDSLGRITLVSSVFGFIVFATMIEFNVVKDTWSGTDPEARLRALNAKDFRQAAVVGTLGGLFAIAALS